MKVILSIHNSCIIAAQLTVVHCGNLVERTKLALYEQTLGIQFKLDILSVHDLLHGSILELDSILSHLERFFLIFLFHDTRR